MTAARRFAKSHPLLRTFAQPVVRAIRSISPPAHVSLARSHAQLFKAIKAGSLIVSLPDFFGSFEFDCYSEILRRIMIHGQYEPELVKAVKCRIDPDLDAIDVGANVGLFTVLMSGLLAASSRTLAIEPTPGALRYLHSNLERNHRTTNVIVFEGVATRIAGEFVINVVPGMDEFSSITELIHPAIEGKPKKQLHVAGDTIDNLVERFALQPGFIKIDTEGAEFEVLSGARQTIAKYRPVIVCESWPDDLLIAAGGTPGGVTNLLQCFGYEVLTQEEEVIAVPFPTIAKGKRPPQP
jgi:FkbM family methyltransferase